MKSVKEKLDEYKEMEVAEGSIHQDIWMTTDMARLIDDYAQRNRVTLQHLIVEILREWIDMHVSTTIIKK